MLPRPPARLAERLCEADAAGVGVVVAGEELVVPAPPEHGPFKAARWRFEEHAFGGWLAADQVGDARAGRLALRAG